VRRAGLGGAVAAGVAALSAMPGAALGQGLPPVNGPVLPMNDLNGVVLATPLAPGVDPHGPVHTISEPSLLRAVPRARCDRRSEPLGGIQGRVSADDLASPQALAGWTCNVTVVANVGTPGGFRTWRYVDAGGHVCAFYDTSITAPASAISTAAGPSPGVAVLDMSDPAHPVGTAMLTSAAMLSPHESLNLNVRRGLLAADVGNGLTTPGSLAVYDVRRDCRHPVLQGELPIRYGHESGWSPDGRTFWVAGGGGEVLAVDVSNPRQPYVVWRGGMYSHGLGLSHDGRTLYQTDPINGNLGILDVGEIQDRRPAPRARAINRITWDTVSVPQNAVPFRSDGKPYLLEFDEFAFRFNPATVDDKVGGVRLIDVSDPRKPAVVSDLRLEVNEREVHQQVSDDPAPLSPGQTFGYAAHYCAVPRRVDPEIVACSFINSGLRVFDIRDLRHPREVAYFVAPSRPGPDGSRSPNFAMSQPAFDPGRREVWYTDSFSGFYALRLSRKAWP
jgi:hypothetical protein